MRDLNLTSERGSSRNLHKSLRDNRRGRSERLGGVGNEAGSIEKIRGMTRYFFVPLFFSLVVTGAVFFPTAQGQEAQETEAQETEAEEAEASYPLHDAIRAGKTEEVHRLLSEQGKKALKQPDGYGMLPLHYASSTGNFEIGRILLEHYSADPNAKPPSDNDWILRGRTPLHIAVTSANLDFVTLLVDKGASPFAGDRNGVLPLHLAVQYGRMRAAKLLMASMGKKVHALDTNKTTPLHLAAQYGRGVLAARLIDLEGKVNARNGYGLTPLHYAASGGHEDVIELLIENGAQINVSNNLGVTPLYLAARDNRMRVVDLLLSEKTLDANTQNEEGMTALTVSLANGHGMVANRLLQGNFDASQQDKLGKTALHHAANGGEVKSLLTLLKKAKINLNGIDKLGNSALHYATQADNKEVVKELLKAGADSSLRNKKDKTAQDIARELGHNEVLSVLR